MHQNQNTVAMQPAEHKNRHCPPSRTNVNKNFVSLHISTLVSWVVCTSGRGAISITKTADNQQNIHNIVGCIPTSPLDDIGRPLECYDARNSTEHRHTDFNFDSSELESAKLKPRDHVLSVKVLIFFLRVHQTRYRNWHPVGFIVFR